MKRKKIAVIGGPYITAQIAEKLKEHDIEVVHQDIESDSCHKYLKNSIPDSVIKITDTYAGLHSFLPRGKKERIIGYYNPETDKEQGRNELCNCGSGLKFKKCCIGKIRTSKEV